MCIKANLISFFLLASSFCWGQEELNIQSFDGAYAIEFTVGGKYLLARKNAEQSLYDISRRQVIANFEFDNNEFVGCSDEYFLLNEITEPKNWETPLSSYQTVDFSGKTIGQIEMPYTRGHFNTDFSLAVFPALNVDPQYQKLKAQLEELENQTSKMSVKAYDKWMDTPEGKETLDRIYALQDQVEEKKAALASKITLFSLPQFKFLKTIETGIRFWRDAYIQPQKPLIYVTGNQGDFHVIDIEQEIILEKYQLPEQAILAAQIPCISPDGKKVILMTNSAHNIYEIGQWDQPLTAELPVTLSPALFTRDSRYFAYIDYLETPGTLRFKVKDLSTGEEIYRLNAYSFSLHPNGKWAAVSDNVSFQIVDFTSKNKEPLLVQKDIFFSVKPMFSPDGKKLVYLKYGSPMEVQELDRLLAEDKDDEKAKAEVIDQVCFLPNGQLSFSTREKRSTSLSLERVDQWPNAHWENLVYNPGDDYLYLIEKKQEQKELIVRYFKDSTEYARFTVSDLDRIIATKFSSGKKYLVAYCFDYIDPDNFKTVYGYYKIFDLENKTYLRDVPSLYSTWNIIFAGKENQLFIPVTNDKKRTNYNGFNRDYFVRNNDTVGMVYQVIDVESGQSKYEVKGIDLYSGQLNVGNNNLLTYHYKTIGANLQYELKLVDFRDDQPKISPLATNHDEGTVIFSAKPTSDKDEVLLFVGKNRQQQNHQLDVELYNIQSQKLRLLGSLEYNIQKNHLTAAVLSLDYRFLAATNSDGSLGIFDLKKGEPIANVYAANKGVIIRTPDNYYMGDKTALDVLQFSRDGRSFPARQFDLKYNRPDIVLSRFPESDPALIEAYRRAYEKRLQKMGFALPEEGEDFHLPELEIINEELPATTNKNQFSLHIHAQDAKYPLNRINVWVNDIPVFGKNGYALKGKKARNFQHTFDLLLSPGNNRIQVSCLNEQGTESLLEEIDINCQVPPKEPTLYLITLGAANYRETAMNLKYSTKDGRDLAQLFQSQQRAYQNVVVKEYYDGDLSKEKLAVIKGELMKSKIEDKVILFYAGHGLVDANLDYYLATSDTDFGNPQANAIPYDMLDDLFDGIPARNRLLLIDACHSGEIDKETTQLIEKNAILPEGNVTFRSFGDKAPASRQLGFSNSLTLMKELFVDLRRGTGVTVISSTSGVEFALEGDQWQNGVYTYSLLRGLTEMAADLNGDGRIMVSELQQYLSEEVPRLTGGHQRPTMRVENLLGDWRVW